MAADYLAQPHSADYSLIGTLLVRYNPVNFRQPRQLQSGRDPRLPPVSKTLNARDETPNPKQVGAANLNAEQGDLYFYPAAFPHKVHGVP